MNAMQVRVSVVRLAAVAGFGLLAGCGSGDDGLENKHPGANDLNVVVAFGDSITQGSECGCVPYPARVAGMIGKVVCNTGIGGSCAVDNVGRTQSAIDRYHPAFLFILYGVNDVIHGGNVDNVLGALTRMVEICRQNSVVPVLMTYPPPIAGHRAFTANTRRLNRGIVALAKSAGVRCVDLEREFATGEKDPAIPEWTVPDPAFYEPDGLHPNDAGTQLIALACADQF